jgi:FlaA1/EpsC-like NDP-sugar epimerase
MERVIQEFAKLNEAIDYRIVRYGNVLYSTGSVLVKWRDRLINGDEITITDPEATRYFWTVEEAIDLIFDCEKNAVNSDPYCPAMKSISIGNLLEAMQQKYGRAKEIKVIGLQKGENLHEKILDDGETSYEASRYSIEEIKKMI